MNVKSSNSRALRNSVNASSHRRNPILFCLVSLFFLALGMTACPVLADDPPNAVPGHIYVHYNAYNVPAATGTYVDVTNTLTFTGDHIYDAYSNELFIDSATNTVTDVYSTVVGLIYQQYN